MALKTDYQNDVLDTSANTRRKYQMVTNDDSTVSFVDKTEYTQTGDTFGAGDINATNEQANKVLDSLNNLFTYDSSSGRLTINLDAL